MVGPQVGGCPDVDALVALVHRGARKNRTLEDHLAGCAICRETVSALAGDSEIAAPSLLPTLPMRASGGSAAGTAAMLEPGTLVGRYVVLGTEGKGGMGVVYSARDPELERTVAVKLLRSDLSEGTRTQLGERLRREARALAQLAHPNVVAVYDVGVFDERMFIAMEYVAGDTLARWLTTPRTQREIIEAYCEAGRGLAAAHAAGIVHRDFKPENVLIGRDGRIRVGDFGLARASAPGKRDTARIGDTTVDDARGPQAPCEGLVAPGDLTAPGMLLGTPYYMAPELYGGAEADARSDQFSFCIALYTALSGERLAEGDRLAVVRPDGQALRWKDTVPPGRVAKRIRAAIQRGLAAEPNARFASLDDLLAELAPRPRRRPLRWALGLGAPLAVIGWLIARPAAVPDPRCTGAAAEFASAWSTEQRDAIATAFAATHAPYASAATERVSVALDEYAARWIDAHTQACRATRILGEQTEPMLALRMSCLERRRQEAAALVDTLATANAEIITHAVEAATKLVDVAACANVAELGQIVAPPADSATRAKLVVLNARLSEARAKYTLGAFAQALEITVPLVAEARPLGYHAYLAEAALLQGRTEYNLGHLTEAEAALDNAVWSAEASRHDLVAGRALTQLMMVVGYSKSEFARGLAFAPRVTAALQRLGGNADLEANLESALAAIDYRQRKLDSAAAHDARAVALLERVYGPQHLYLADAIEGLAMTEMEQGHVARSIELLKRALGIAEQVRGRDHPLVARTLHNLAHAHLLARDNTSAEAEARRAATLRETTLGPDHPDLVENLSLLGTALRRNGKLADALAIDRRALALGEQVFAPDDLNLEGPLLELGAALGLSGEYAEADRHLRRLEALAAKGLGADHTDAMLAVTARGDVLMLQGRWREAAALYERAIPILDSAQGTEDDFSSAVAHLGKAYVELHQPARAQTLLQRYANKLVDVSPATQVLVDFTTARALWDGGGDRVRARDVAAHALEASRRLASALLGPSPHAAAGAETIAAVDAPAPAAIERWLARHPHR